MAKYKPIHTGMKDHPYGQNLIGPYITHYERVEEMSTTETINRVRSVHQLQVDDFNERKGVRLPISPFIPDRDGILNQIRIIFDEVLELVQGAGVDIGVRYHGAGAGGIVPIAKSVMRYETNPRPVDIKEVVDGFADVSVTITGLLSMFGVADLPVLKKVDESNLDKYNIPICHVCGIIMQMDDNGPPAIYHCQNPECSFDGEVKGHYVDGEGKLKKPSNWEERHKYDIQEVLINQGMPESMLLPKHRINKEEGAYE